MTKYDNLVYTFEKQYNNWGDFMPRYQAYFRGHDCMPDSNFYSSYRCYMAKCFVDRMPNFHTEEEYLTFTGYDMQDPWGSFDAEIEIWIGKDLTSMEKHVITEPTILRVPAYTWHCPLEYKRVDKPVYFQVSHLRGKFGTFHLHFFDDGHTELAYSGSAGHQPCKLDQTKQCSFCGKCMPTGVRKDIPADTAEEAVDFFKAVALNSFTVPDSYGKKG